MGKPVIITLKVEAKVVVATPNEVEIIEVPVVVALPSTLQLPICVDEALEIKPEFIVTKLSKFDIPST